MNNDEPLEYRIGGKGLYLTGGLFLTVGGISTLYSASGEAASWERTLLLTCGLFFLGVGLGGLTYDRRLIIDRSNAIVRKSLRIFGVQLLSKSTPIVGRPGLTIREVTRHRTEDHEPYRLHRVYLRCAGEDWMVDEYRLNSEAHETARAIATYLGIEWP